MKSLFCLITFFLFSCCTIYKHNYFTNCENGKLTGLNSKLALNGYYLWTDLNDSKDRSYAECIFLYNDGTFASAGGFKTQQFAEQYIRTAGDRLYEDFMVEWGRYRLQGDTIIAQTIYQKEAMRYAVMETWFAIKNDKSIFMFKTVCHSCQGKEVKARHGETYLSPATLCEFVPFKDKPDSTRYWLRKKRWYKCR